MKAVKGQMMALAFLSSVYSFGFATENAIWNKLERGILASAVTTLAVHPQNNSLIFAASQNSIFKSENTGANFVPVLTLASGKGNINFLYMAPQEPASIYAATDEGLFVSGDLGGRWEKIFASHANGKNECFWVLKDSGKIYLATQEGLFIKENGSSGWKKHEGVLGEKAVYFIAATDKFVYFATQDEVFQKGIERGEVTKVFSFLSHEINGEVNGETFDSEGPGTQKQITFLTADKEGKRLFISGPKGIFQSSDEGNTWQKMETTNLPLGDVTSLSVCKADTLFAGTRKGVFQFSGGRWKVLYEGLETNKISFLACDQKENLYAATERGVFLLSMKEARESKNTIAARGVNHFEFEPAVNEVHAMAIAYAEVAPQKIELWRKQASRRAWLPTISAGLDRSATDFYHWDTGPSPDELRKGRDLMEWDVSFSWDLGDLVWNADQTSIDSRSKLMVELREDILDQVTRLYFERRRLQFELNDATDLTGSARRDKELRIAELTALIDGFTGGKFSRKIEENNIKNKNQKSKFK